MKLHVTSNGHFVFCDDGAQIENARPATEEERTSLIDHMSREHEVAKARGVQAHHVSAAGIVVDGTLTLTLTLGTEAKATGDRILDEVRRALALANNRARVRMLGRLVDICADVVLRMPEVHEFLDRLYSAGQVSAIKGILGERRRGRPRTNILTQVTIVGHLKRQKLWTKESAKMYARRFSKSVAAVENDHSKYRRLLELYGSRFVDAAKLTHDRWRWPASSQVARGRRLSRRKR